MSATMATRSSRILQISNGLHCREDGSREKDWHSSSRWRLHRGSWPALKGVQPRCAAAGWGVAYTRDEMPGYFIWPRSASPWPPWSHAARDHHGHVEGQSQREDFIGRCCFKNQQLDKIPVKNWAIIWARPIEKKCEWLKLTWKSNGVSSVSQNVVNDARDVVVDSRTTGMLTCLAVDVGWCVDVSLGRLLLLDGALPHFRIANHFERSVQIRIASARPQRLRRLLLFCLFQW